MPAYGGHFCQNYFFATDIQNEKKNTYIELALNDQCRSVDLSVQMEPNQGSRFKEFICHLVQVQNEISYSGRYVDMAKSIKSILHIPTKKHY